MVLTSNVKRMSFSVESRIDFPRATPALLTRMVGSPTSLRMREATDEMEEGTVMSHL
jgi:hypothetical protein